MAPSKPARPKTSDLVSQLGLRFAFSKKKDDRKISPLVEQMYDRDLPDLAREHHNTAMDRIPSCPGVKAAAMALTEKYGDCLWPDGDYRPWLFNPGEGSTSAPYPRNLYYSDATDRKFIKHMMYELVVQRVLRYRKENIRTTSSQSDTSWSPSTATRQLRTSHHKTSNPPAYPLHCWASELSAWTNSQNYDQHLDASGLKEAGVWLGSYNEEKEVINGPSFDEVTRNIFVDTLGGAERGPNEPWAFNEAPETEVLDTRCAACGSSAASSTRPLQIRCIAFDWEEKDTETHMEKNIWTYKCRLGGKDVFALLKDEGSSGSNNAHHLFSFWRVDGGYTKSTLLKVVQSSVDASDPGGTSLKRKYSGPHGFNSRKKSGTPLWTGSVSSHTDSDSEVPARSPLRQFTAVNDPRQQTLPFQNLPYRAAEDEIAAQGTLEQRNISNTMDHDSLYDTTPRPERVQNIAQEIDTTVAVRPTSRPISLPAVSERAMSAPLFTLRFRLWLTTNWSTTRKAIFLNDAMQVSDVLASVRAKMASKRSAETELEFRIWLGDRDTDGENYIDLDDDDEDGWETVLEFAKSADGGDMTGMVSTQE